MKVNIVLSKMITNNFVFSILENESRDEFLLH